MIEIISVDDDVCSGCLDCLYYHHEFWNCPGQKNEPCFEYTPNVYKCSEEVG